MWYDAPDDNGYCPVCAKELPKGRSDWGYRIEGRDFCSYKCMMVADRQYKRGREYREIQSELGTALPPDLIDEPHKVTEAELSGWIRMLQNGAGITAIAKAYKRNFNHVHDRLSNMGLLPMDRRLKSKNQDEAVYRMVRDGTPVVQVAAEMGLSTRTVYRIIKRVEEHDNQRTDQ